MNEKIEAARARVAREASCWTHGGPSQLREAVMDLEIAEKEAAPRYSLRSDLKNPTGSFRDCVTGKDLGVHEVLALLNAERTPPHVWTASGCCVKRSDTGDWGWYQVLAGSPDRGVSADEAASLLADALNKERTP